MQSYTGLFNHFLEFDADTRHKLLSLIQTLQGNEFDFVCFQLFAPDQAVAAWNKTIPMTEDLFKQCQKMVQQYSQFRKLIDAGKSREEIMAAMQISIATYYRYQKMYQELEGEDQSITGTQTMGQFRIMQWVQKNYGNSVKVKFSGRNTATLYEKQGGQLQVQYEPEKKEIIIKKSERLEN